MPTFFLIKYFFRELYNILYNHINKKVFDKKIRVFDHKGVFTKIGGVYARSIDK